MIKKPKRPPFVAHLKRAIKLAKSQYALAAYLRGATKNESIIQATVYNWLTRDKSFPARYAAHIETFTKGEVKKHQLCPLEYPLE